MKERLDVLLVNRGLAETRNKAQAIIMSGIVYVDGVKEDKSGQKFDENAAIEVRGSTLKYVSRGGLKLEKAMTNFNVAVEGKICMDVGSSTGGFTDCMLQNGARLVYAVDVGKDQLDERLRTDKRVISLENTDVREAAEKISDIADFISVDVSFISLKLVLPEVKTLLKQRGQAVALIKPQFEVGKSGLGKHGIVKSDMLRSKAVNEIKDFAEQIGFAVSEIIQSPITGGDGNIEYLIYLLL